MVQDEAVEDEACGPVADNPIDSILDASNLDDLLRDSDEKNTKENKIIKSV